MLLPSRASAHRQLVFPVIGGASYSNDYLASRGDGTHNAIDIIAGKHQKLVAAVNGTVVRVVYPEASWGYSVTIEDDEGWRYRYIHINNDTPGTNDNNGGGMNAYGLDMKRGNRVIRGQHIGYVGDSGNSNGVSHLHFEMFRPDGSVTNPYVSLTQAKKIGSPVKPIVQPTEFLPFGEAKLGGTIAIGNFDSDPQLEYAIGKGRGQDPHVKVFDTNNTLLRTFSVYSASFRGGVNVASGDVDNDGVDEIITGAGPGGGPRVRVFEADGTPGAGDLFAYSADFKGGVNVASGDVDNDGVDEIITGAGAGGGPRVRVFEADGTPGIGDFFAYSSNFSGGVNVASGNVTGTSADEIVTGVGSNGIPLVKVFNTAGQALSDFNAYSANQHGGVRVAVGDVRSWMGDEEIVTILARGTPQIRLFEADSTLLTSGYAVDEWWQGYHDVTAGEGIIKSMTGVNRRTSVRSDF
jgi:hypothetical protein